MSEYFYDSMWWSLVGLAVGIFVGQTEVTIFHRKGRKK